MTDEHIEIETSPESTPAESPKTAKPVSKQKGFFASKRNRIIVGVLILLVAVGLTVREVYRRPPSDGLVRAVSYVLPLPAVTVNGDSVSLSDYLVEYDALAHSLESAGDGLLPEDTEIQDAIMDTIINKLLLHQMAAEYGVEVTEEEVDAYYADILAVQESEDVFADELENTFGWTVEEFKERVVEPIVLLTEMSDYVLSTDTFQSERRALIEEGYARLENGEDFDYVADEIHGQIDPTIQTDLGYVKLSVIPESWSAVVEELEVGTYSEILDLYEGFAVFQVLDRIVAGEDTQLQLYGMTVPKKTLEEILLELREVAEIENYLE